MQYSKMMDLLTDATEAGGSNITGYVNEQLAEVFDQWLDALELGELPEEEYEALKLALEEGYGIRPACACRE
jgi:hypothetical protein